MRASARLLERGVEEVLFDGSLEADARREASGADPDMRPSTKMETSSSLAGVRAQMRADRAYATRCFMLFPCLRRIRPAAGIEFIDSDQRASPFLMRLTLVRPLPRVRRF